MISLTCLHPARLAAAWWVRLLLVMVLAADLVGGPLHAHHHDAGADGAALFSGSAHAAAALQQQLRNAGEPRLFHTTTTLRARAQTAAADKPQACSPLPAALLPAPVEPWRVGEQQATDTLALNDEWPPPRPSQQSRPPPGRAPPACA